MSQVESHPEVAEYLDRIRRAAAELPETRRVELVEQIRGHLDEALGGEADSVRVREELDRLGEPEVIVAEARGDESSSEPVPPAPALLPAGNAMATASFVTGIGGLCLFWLFGVGLILGLAAVVFGAVGMHTAKTLPGEGGHGRAKTGLVLGVVGAIASAAVIALLLPSSVDVSEELEVEPVPAPRFAPVDPSG